MNTENNYNAVLDACLCRWGEKKDDNHFKVCSTFPEWIEQFSDSMKVIVLELLNHFDYYSHKEVNTQLRKLHLELIEKTTIDINDTIYTVLPSNSPRWNSGYAYISEYKMINGVNTDNIIPDFHKALNYFESIKKVVFVDDCCGTGDTFLRCIKEHLDSFKGKEIFYVVVYAMHEAIDRILSYSRENELNICIICNEKDKAFSSEKPYFNQKDVFINESKSLGISGSYILGYEESEALASFYNDTPNNTLGCFWYSNSGFKPLFYREHTIIPDWKKMKERKKQRDENNYLRKVQAKK